MKYELSYEEAEANRRDPQWGSPVQDLALHASHWIEVAGARFPHLHAQMDALNLHLAEAVGELGTEDGLLNGRQSDGEIVAALEKVVSIMREVAPLLADLTRSH